MSIHVLVRRLPRPLLLFCATASALAALGCAGTVQYTATVAPTTLVTVSPGVWVVYDYPEAIFYSDNYYWWWNGGTWYKSRYADDGWVAVTVVSLPAPLRQVRRPQGYVRYRVETRSRPVPRAHVRRTYTAQPAPQRAHDNGRGRGRTAPPPERDNGRGRGRRDSPPARDEGRGPPPSAEPRDDDRGRGRGRGPSEEPGDSGRGRD